MPTIRIAVMTVLSCTAGAPIGAELAVLAQQGSAPPINLSADR
jgi:hypothetical protein